MGAMVIIGLLLASLLLLVLFLYLELVEMALGMFVAVVVLGAIGFAFQLAAVMTIVAILALALIAGLGYLVWRMFGRAGPTDPAGTAR